MAYSFGPVPTIDQHLPTFLLAEDRERRIYISGPMTGIPEFNFPAFNEAAARLKELGWDAVNPADHGIVHDATREDYLRYDLAALTTCRAIIMLPGWNKSQGAILELAVASTLKMEVFTLDDAEHPSFAETVFKA